MGMYPFFRNHDMVLFEWIPGPEYIGAFSIAVPPSWVFSPVLYNVPDMPWFLSGILFLRWMWFHDTRWQGGPVFLHRRPDTGNKPVVTNRSRNI
jgi:hypothetical protein